MAFYDCSKKSETNDTFVPLLPSKVSTVQVDTSVLFSENHHLFFSKVDLFCEVYHLFSPRFSI